MRSRSAKPGLKQVGSELRVRRELIGGLRLPKSRKEIHADPDPQQMRARKRAQRLKELSLTPL
jgi:hypothetical protein